MKKIYVCMLTVAMLLVSGNLAAGNVAKIGSTEYATFEAAFSALQNGETLELLQNVTLTQRLSKWATEGSTDSMTVDLKGFTITSSGDLSAIDKDHNYDGVFDIWHVRMLFKNGTIDDIANTSGTTVNIIDGAHVALRGIHLIFKPNGINSKKGTLLNYGAIVTDNSYEEYKEQAPIVYVENCVIEVLNGCGAQIAGLGQAFYLNTQVTQMDVDGTKPDLRNCIAASAGGEVFISGCRLIGDDRCLHIYNSGGGMTVTGTSNIKGKTSTITVDNTTNSVDYLGRPNYSGKGSYVEILAGDFDGQIKQNTTDPKKVGVTLKGGRYVQDPTTITNATIADGYEKLDNGDGTWSVVKTAEKKTDFSASTKESVVIPASNITVSAGTKEAKQITLKGKDITVQNGAILSVGDGGIIIGKDGDDKYGKVIVEAGGKLVVDGLVYNDNAANIIVKAKEGQNGYFLISPDVQLYGTNHPKGTVELYSKAYNKGDGTYVWQRFGVPSYLSNVKRSDVKYDSKYPTAIMYWNYQQFSWQSMADEATFEPFQCYTLTTNNTDKDNRATYSFGCDLVGNGDATLPIKSEWNYYANSYTAPISLSTLATDIYNNNIDNISAGIWIYRASDNWWDVVSYQDVFEGTVPENNKNVEPMQAFILQKIAPVSEKVLDYKANVWNTVVTPAPSAPARKQVANDWAVATIHFSNESGYADKVRVIEGADFSDEFDNGFDVAKYMNPDAFNVFAETENGAEIYVAKANLEGQMISLNTKAETSFTMTFSNVRDLEYSIKDMLTGTITPIVEGGEYVFSAQANSNNKNRFMLVPSHKQPTAIEDVTNAAVKGIYSVMGQYMGETSEWNNIPAGIYVVDGVKVVK